MQTVLQHIVVSAKGRAARVISVAYLNKFIYVLII